MSFIKNISFNLIYLNYNILYVKINKNKPLLRHFFNFFH
nr:MAG TPA: hypothetical protein [Caudoviricetes sp.]